MDKCTGNHVAALAYAAKLRKAPAYIVILENAPTCKIENVICLDVYLVLCKGTIVSSEEAAAKVIHETGALYIPSSNDGHIITYCFGINFLPGP